MLVTELACPKPVLLYFTIFIRLILQNNIFREIGTVRLNIFIRFKNNMLVKELASVEPVSDK